MGNQMTASKEQVNPDQKDMEPLGEPPSSDVGTDSTCIKEKLDNLIEGYLKSTDVKFSEKHATSNEMVNKHGILFDQSVLKTVEKKAENNNTEIVTNGTKENNETDSKKNGSDSSLEKSIPSKSKAVETAPNIASFESMIERALNDSMKNMNESNGKTRILEMCGEDIDTKKTSDLNGRRSEIMTDRVSDNMSLSKKNVMFLKDHIERVLEKNFPSIGNKKEDSNDESKLSGKPKPRPSPSVAQGLTLEEHMQKLIDEHLSKENLSSERDSSAPPKSSTSAQGSDDLKKNVITTSSGYDSVDNVNYKSVIAVSKPQETLQSQSTSMSKCHSVETVVDRIIKKAVNDSFPSQKLQAYPKDQKWKTLRDEIYSECDSGVSRKCVDYNASMYVNPMKTQDKKPQSQWNMLNSGSLIRSNMNHTSISEPHYFYPPCVKPNSNHPAAHKQDPRFDNKEESQSCFLGYPIKGSEKSGRPKSGSDIIQRTRVDIGSRSSVGPRSMHDMHMMPHMNSHYPPSDKSKYTHPTSVRYPGKSMEDLQSGIPSAMGPGPSPTQRFCNQNSQFRMPQLYPNNPPIPSPREYFNNPTSTKDHLLVPAANMYPGNRNHISKSPVLSHSSPNHHPPTSPKIPRQPSPSVYQPSKPDVKQSWQRQDQSPASQSHPRKRETPGLDLSVKQTSQMGNEDLPLDLTCKKPRVSPSHPQAGTVYSSGMVYPSQMEMQHDVSKSIHISQLQNSMDKFCQQASTDMSPGRVPPPVKGHEHFVPSLMMNHPHWSNAPHTGSKQGFPPNMPNPSSERSEVVRPHPIHQQHLPRMPIRPPITSSHHLPQESPESPSDSNSAGIKRSGSVSRHEPIQNIIGNHSPNDILYLICRLCNQTYGSPYGFRKHFRNQHGFEPRAEHTVVQTISGTKAMQAPAVGPHFEMQGMNQMGVPPHLSPIPKSQSPREYISHNNSPNNFERPPGAINLRPSGGNFSYSHSNHENRRPASIPSSIAPICESNVSDPQRPSLKADEKPEQQKNPKYLECHECGQTFQLNDFGSYKRHCRTHGNPRMDPFISGINDSSVPGNPSDDPHLANDRCVTKGGENLIEAYSCKYCRFTSKLSGTLEEHISQQHPEKQKKFICILCNGKFHLYDQFKLHMEKIHCLSAPSYTQFKCPETSIEKEGKIFIKEEIPNVETKSSIPSDLNKSYKAISSSQITKMSADNAVTSASPDSSCDPITSSQADSQTTGTITTSHNSTTEVKQGQQSQPGIVSRQTSCDSESDKSVDYTEMKYLHKKFKRKAFSSEKGESQDVKKLKTSSGVDSPCSNSCTSLDSDSNSVQTTEDNEGQPADEGQKSLYKGKLENISGEELTQSEARHNLPFVWERITRSQVGKTVKPAK